MYQRLYESIRLTAACSEGPPPAHHSLRDPPPARHTFKHWGPESGGVQEMGLEGSGVQAVRLEGCGVQDPVLPSNPIPGFGPN